MSRELLQLESVETAIETELTRLAGRVHLKSGEWDTQLINVDGTDWAVYVRPDQPSADLPEESFDSLIFLDHELREPAYAVTWGDEFMTGAWRCSDIELRFGASGGVIGYDAAADWEKLNTPDDQEAVLNLLRAFS